MRLDLYWPCRKRLHFAAAAHTGRRSGTVVATGSAIVGVSAIHSVPVVVAVAAAVVAIGFEAAEVFANRSVPVAAVVAVVAAVVAAVATGFPLVEAIANHSVREAAAIDSGWHQLTLLEHCQDRSTQLGEKLRLWSF